MNKHEDPMPVPAPPPIAPEDYGPIEYYIPKPPIAPEDYGPIVWPQPRPQREES